MQKKQLAIDLGTTNTVVAQWNDNMDEPEVMHIDSICRHKNASKKIDDSYTVPSCVYLLPPKDVLNFPLNYIFRKFKSKTGGYIGKQAMDHDGGMFSPAFADRFKSYLGQNSFQIIGKLGNWKFNAEDITRIFLKQLFAQIKQEHHIKPSQVTICTPVDFFEYYRARLKKILGHLNIGRIKTIDEPVAAALGYGLCLDDPKHILVIDFGGGTLDVALIATQEDVTDKGHCSVIAKEGIPMGGNQVDAWIVESIFRHFDYDFDRFTKDPEIQWWHRVLLAEACRLKESLFFTESETFYLLPSPVMKKFCRNIMGNLPNLDKPIDYTKDHLVELLESHHLYELLDELIQTVVQSAYDKGISENMIDEIIMVGGSTLLPNIYAVVEKRFGRDKVRAWQPFNAVAFGAAAFSAGKCQKSDFITHDYAFMTYNRKTLEPEYNVIIPKGTGYPTNKDFWKKQLSPTCALGEPESLFKLIICEIGRNHSKNQEFTWDQNGNIHSSGSLSDQQLIIPLNESDPTLGYLNPPHYPSDKGARVEISFMINEDRWLCTSVVDLKTQKILFSEKPVIRLK